MEKLNLTQQKHAFTNKRNVPQHEINTKKQKGRFSHLLFSREKISKGEEQ